MSGWGNPPPQPRVASPRLGGTEAGRRVGPLGLAGSVARPRGTDQRDVTQRAVLVGGFSLLGILTLLACVTVRLGASRYPFPYLAEIERNARLFQDLTPHVMTLPIAHYAIFAWSCVVALWLVYLPLIWRVRRGRIDHRLVAGGAIALALLAVLIPPVYSTDIYSYAIFGRLSAVYHVNPYLTTAMASAPHDIVMPYLYWDNIPSPYGPLWTLASEVLAAGRQQSVLDLTLRFKLVSFIAVLLDGWLIFLLVRRRWPHTASWAYLAFAWNPLVLTEGVVVGHNDVVILLAVLASAYLVALRRPHLAVAGLTVSSLVKYSTLPILGVAGLRLLFRTPVGRRIGMLLRLGLVTAAVTICAFAPYWAGWRVLMSTLAEPGRGVNNPVLMVLHELVRLLTAGQVRLGTTSAVIISVLLFSVWQGISLWRERLRTESWTLDGELAAWAATLAVFLLVWPRIHTWYFLVPLGLAIAAGRDNRRLFGGILVLTVFSYISYIR